MGTHVLFAIYALGASVLIAVLFKLLWGQHHHRTIQEKWEERELLLDRLRTRAPRHEILEQRARPAATRERDAQRRLQIVEPEPFARVLFILSRDQRELVTFLHKDFAAEEAEGLIEILMDRRQSPQWQGAQPPETDGRRDPGRNRAVATNLREAGWALVGPPARFPETARSKTHFPVALGR